MKVQGRIPLAPGVDPGFDIIELPESKLQRRGVYPFVPVAARGVACDWLVARVFVKYYEAGGQEYTRYGNGVSALLSE